MKEKTKKELALGLIDDLILLEKAKDKQYIDKLKASDGPKKLSLLSEGDNWAVYHLKVLRELVEAL